MSAALPDGLCAEVLDALDSGALLLAPDLTVQYANARWRGWIREPFHTGHAFEGILLGDTHIVMEDLRELMTSAETKPFHLTLVVAGPKDVRRRLEATAHRALSGILIEARADDEDLRFSNHGIARRLAAASDMGDVLRALCEIAMRECSGTGAAVMRTIGKQGEVVAAAGNLAATRGRAFELEGSLLSEAVREQDVVLEESYTESRRPLARAVPELAVGPVIVVPLRAHEDTLGVLAVSRAVGGRPFRSREIERLRLLADHAALGVHKSMLLMQAQSADKAKGRFLATMSHELRTPLTALTGYNELLADQVIGPLSDSQLDILERMRSVTTHLSAMIEEILAFTSLEEGREIVRPSEFLAADLATSAIAVIEPIAEARGIRLERVLPPAPIRITSDIDKVRQILVNLLGNAVKFTDKGSVTLRLSVRGVALRMEVEDTGMGIPQEELSRLFRPFSQVDAGLTRRHGGTGLGLYISRRLATLLQGHIEVQSKPGVGSTFTVVLPLHYHAKE